MEGFMNYKSIVFAVLVNLVALFHHSHVGAVQIDSIAPTVGAEGDVVTITGSGFGTDREHAAVKFRADLKDCPAAIVYPRCMEYKEYNAIISSITDTQLRVITPSISEKRILKVKAGAYNGTAWTYSNEVDFGVYSSPLIEESIILKQSGMKDSAIVDHMYFQEMENGASPAKRKGVFGNIRLEGADIAKLKKAGFDDDFIGKFEGQQQRVTIGIAGIWLYRTSELVAAPMIRILLVPRSFFYEKADYWGTWGWKYTSWIPKPQGVIDIARWDLNFGITTSTRTSEHSNEEKTNYALVGLSHQINAAAFLNFGAAIATGSAEGIKRQYYAGFTVDSNILKVVGLMDK